MYQSDELNLKVEIKAQLERLHAGYLLHNFNLNNPQKQATFAGEINENGILIPPDIRLLLFGNRGGKSTWGILEDICWCQGARLYLPPDHPAYKTPFEPPISIRLITKSFSSTAEDVILRIFQEICPPHLYKKPKRRPGSGFTNLIEFETGSTLRIMTYNQDIDDFEGNKAHANHYDEPCPYPIFEASERALVDYGGFSWITATLTRNKNAAWIKRELMDKADGKKIFVVYGSIWDNERRVDKQTGKVTGGLTKEYISKYLDKIKDPHMRKARETGIPKHFVGNIYSIFDRKIHVIEPKENEYFKKIGGVVPNWWPVIMTCDPHEHKPYAFVWFAVNPENGYVFAIDEYPDIYFHEMDTDDKNIDMLIEIIKKKERGRHVVLRLMDSNYFMKKSLTTNNTLGVEFALPGRNIYFTQAEDKPQSTNIQLLENMLSYNSTLPLSATNEPEFYIFPNCINLIFGFENWSYNDPSSKQASEMDVYEKPGEKFKCFPDMAGWVARAMPKRFTGTTRRQIMSPDSRAAIKRDMRKNRRLTAPIGRSKLFYGGITRLKSGRIGEPQKNGI